MSTRTTDDTAVVEVESRETEAPALRPQWDRRRVLLIVTGVALTVLTALSLPVVDLSAGRLLSGIGDMWSLLGRMVPPRFEDLGHTLGLLVETFFIAFAGTVMAFVLSVPLAVAAARNTSPWRFGTAASRAVITVCRAIPELVFALIFVRAVGLGVLAGVLALGIHAVGMLGKIYADAIEEIDEGQRLAVVSTGAGRLQAFTTGVIPQVVPTFVGMFLYRLDINVRLSTVLGFVGAGGIGQALRANLGNLRYQEGLAIVLMIFVLIVGVEALSSSVRRQLLGDDAPRPRSLLSILGGLGRRVRDAATRASAPEPARSSEGTSSLAFDRDTVRPPWTSERKWRFGYGGLFVAGLVASAAVMKIDPMDVIRALPKLWDVFLRFFPPDVVSDAPALGSALLETVAIGFAATMFGTILSIPIAFLAARNVAPARWIYVAARYLVVAVRGVPELVMAVIFVAAVGLGPFPGVMALAVGSVGFLAKLQSDAIEGVRQGPRDAVDATGATRGQQTMAAVVPQVTPSFVGNVLYMLDINIRASVVLGIVGAGGVGFLLVQAIRTLAFQRVATILLGVFVVVYAIERLSGWIRSQLI